MTLTMGREMVGHGERVQRLLACEGKKGGFSTESSDQSELYREGVI